MQTAMNDGEIYASADGMDQVRDGFGAFGMAPDEGEQVTTSAAVASVARGAAKWQFLNEPAWRWFIFFGMLIAFVIVWRGIIEFMK